MPEIWCCPCWVDKITWGRENKSLGHYSPNINKTDRQTVRFVCLISCNKKVCHKWQNSGTEVSLSTIKQTKSLLGWSSLLFLHLQYTNTLSSFDLTAVTWPLNQMFSELLPARTCELRQTLRHGKWTLGTF